MESPSPYTSPPPNSTLALVSLIAGILGLTLVPGLASIIAIITGGMARKEIRESGGRLGGDGMARIGIILGWVAVALGLVAICCFAISFAIPFLLAFIDQVSGLTGLVLVF